MNKKIFTLLVGALLLIGSSFTASAQTKTVHHKAYGETSFVDTLRADTAKYLVTKNKGYYLLSITDIANPTPSIQAAFPQLEFDGLANPAKSKSTDLSYVMFVDEDGNLAIDTLSNLDIDNYYDFEYNNPDVPSFSSRKIGAMRRAQWCVTYNEEYANKGSNVVFDFTNMQTGEMLEAPLRSMNSTAWSHAEGHDRWIYDNSKLNLKDPDFIVSGWNFSYTYVADQALQTGRPIYSYVAVDSVLVLTLNEKLGYEKPNNTTSGVGGWSVTVKQVAASDLVKDIYGNVRLRYSGAPADAKYVENVLLFTLKKLNPFVMNAEDYNAVFNSLVFTPDAKNTKEKNDGWNPFTKPGKLDPYGDGYLRAYEVNDSLYRYGYMQFQHVDAAGAISASAYGGGDKGSWLYVDTGFMNYGNEKHLKFAYSDHRRDTSIFSGTRVHKAWGEDFESSFTGLSSLTGIYSYAPDTVYYFSQRPAPGTTFDFQSFLSMSTTNPNYKALQADSAIRMQAFKRDSMNYYIKYYTDSLMENQSKFRVVYYPFEDSTFINVYQSRVRYEDIKNNETPNWWTNSFRIDNDGTFTFPYDFWNGYGYVIKGVTEYGNASFYGHWGGGLIPANGKSLKRPAVPGEYFHTFAEYYDVSSPVLMDKVMISTADTSVFYVMEQPLSHLYGFGELENGKGAYYKDSLFYVDIQNLYTGGINVATIAEARVKDENRLYSHISLGFVSCEQADSETKADISNDLYLIRNSKGEYLCVPIWSITDSVYWVTPEKWEDPTQTPSYQWAVENIRATKGSPFKLTNREFEKVSFNYVYVLEEGDAHFVVGDAIYSNSRFTKSGIIRSGIVDKKDAIEKGKFEQVKKFSQATYSFLPLAKDVKEDQLLGYTYIDPDSTIIDVYALKYAHFLAQGRKARYFGWNGYDHPKTDTVVYVNSIDYHEKLYFQLQQMEYENIGDERLLIGYNEKGDKIKGAVSSSANLGKSEFDIDDYPKIFERYGNKANNHQNRDSLVLENFGYMPFKRTTAGKYEYDYVTIPYLKPLARQAYRLLLKDYLKYSPTITGDYVTVGQQDNYILSDRITASRPYVPNSGRAEGVFGIPYFYFRNTYFDYPGINKHGEDTVEDYFALIQRVDTISPIGGSKLNDIHEYLNMQFNNLHYNVADRVVEQIRESRELGAFIAAVSDNMGKLKIAVRGDIAISPSTFTLEQDDDPIYRRFHSNDQFERTGDDSPLTLEFHRLLNPAQKLYENNGSDRSAGGGYGYNTDKNGELYKDSLGNIISYLGIKNIYQHPSLSSSVNPHGNTNYAIYVDTAYIRRGTGWIKPQYMFVVDPFVKDPCDVCDVGSGTQEFRGYTIGRYMFNTAMYAKKIVPSAADLKDFKASGGINYDLVQPINDKEFHAPINGVSGEAYTEITSSANKWERLAFSWAIHRGDSLYVLKGVAPEYQGREYDPEVLIAELAKQYGGTSTKGNIDFKELEKVKGMNMAAVKALGKTIGLHAIIRLDDNRHKDWVFSLRFIERHADDFVIESETELRDRINGNVIRPGYAGWVKWQNNVPTISRGDTKELMGEGEAWNVEFAKTEPVSNDGKIEGASAVSVIGGTGAVTILNATGKNVVISNILGQTLANTKLNSDNASISIPAGIVVVAVEGESAFKAVVK